MEYLIGSAFTLVFFVVVSLGAYLGYRIGKTRSKPPDREIDEQELKKAKEVEEHFQKLMNYDVDQARERKKVV